MNRIICTLAILLTLATPTLAQTTKRSDWMRELDAYYRRQEALEAQRVERELQEMQLREMQARQLAISVYRSCMSTVYPTADPNDFGQQEMECRRQALQVYNP